MKCLIAGLATAAALIVPTAAHADAQGDAQLKIVDQVQHIADGLVQDGNPVFGYSVPAQYMWMYNGNWYGRAWISWAMPADQNFPVWFHLDVYDCGAWIGCTPRPDLSTHSRP